MDRNSKKGRFFQTNVVHQVFGEVYEASGHKSEQVMFSRHTDHDTRWKRASPSQQPGHVSDPRHLGDHAGHEKAARNPSFSSDKGHVANERFLGDNVPQKPEILTNVQAQAEQWLDGLLTRHSPELPKIASSGHRQHLSPSKPGHETGKGDDRFQRAIVQVMDQTFEVNPRRLSRASARGALPSLGESRQAICGRRRCCERLLLRRTRSAESRRAEPTHDEGRRAARPAPRPEGGLPSHPIVAATDRLRRR